MAAPADVVLEIVKDLSVSQVLQFCRTSTHYRHVCRSRRFWTLYLQRRLTNIYFLVIEISVVDQPFLVELLNSITHRDIDRSYLYNFISARSFRILRHFRDRVLSGMRDSEISQLLSDARLSYIYNDQEMSELRQIIAGQ